MKKGKLKEEKKYSSIILLPHSPGEVRILKLTNLYFKMGAIITIISVVLICTGLFVTYAVYENYKLKESISRLSDINAEQNNLLDDKITQIDQLRQKEEMTGKKIDDFQDKFRELTENYLSERSGSVETSRSGEYNDRTFMHDIKDLKSILDSLREDSSTSTEAFADLSETESRLKKYMDSIPALWPASGKLGSGFGGRRDPFRLGKRFHEGIDIAASYGQAIKASGSGRVTFSGWRSGYGYTIIINHGHEITTLYGHASKLLVKEGQTVNKGDLIAKVGNSGRSTGAHLHFEVRINDNPVDPLKYLDN